MTPKRLEMWPYHSLNRMTTGHISGNLLDMRKMSCATARGGACSRNKVPHTPYPTHLDSNNVTLAHVARLHG
jgi:hypothetical protein